MRAAIVALVLTMSGSGLAGMGLSNQEWRELKTDALFLGVFHDFRGPRALFLVEKGSGALIGPLDLDAPSGPGWALTPGKEPRDLQPGQPVSVIYSAIVPSDQAFGHPPPKNPKARAERASVSGPCEGVFVSLEKHGAPVSPAELARATADPLALALLKDPRVSSLSKESDVQQAAVGFLINRDRSRLTELIESHPKIFRSGELDFEAVATLILDGLRGFSGLSASEASRTLPPIAKLYRDGKKAEARAALQQKKDVLHFWLASDRWKRPPHPMESSPGQPNPGPFLRWPEYFGLGYLTLHYTAPEFLQLMTEEFRWSDPPF